MVTVDLNSCEDSNPFDWHEFSSSTIMGIASMKSMLMYGLLQELWTAVTNFQKSPSLKYKTNQFLNIMSRIQAGGNAVFSDQKLDNIWYLLVYLNKEKVWVTHCCVTAGAPLEALLGPELLTSPLSPSIESGGLGSCCPLMIFRISCFLGLAGSGSAE